MATTGAAFNAERVLREALPEDLKLDPQAKTKLDQLIKDGATRLAQEPHRAGEAQAAMRSLAHRLEMRRESVASPTVNAEQIALALKDLCPLFPICR
jgi:hypothetical protein